MNNYVSIYTPKKAVLIKRLAAFLLDTILVMVLFTGFLYLASLIFNYDGLKEELNNLYIKYNVYILNSENVYEFCSYEDATCVESYNLLLKDENYILVFNNIQNFLIYAPIISMFLSLLVFEFIMPLILKNGSTIGMKLLNIALISDKDIKVKNSQVFIRFLFGKFIFNGFIPVFCILFIFFSNNQMLGFLLLIIDLAVNIICYFGSKNKVFIPDIISRCYPVDNQEQMYFKTIEELNLAKGKEANLYNKKDDKYGY